MVQERGTVPLEPVGHLQRGWSAPYLEALIRITDAVNLI
jgi:hypothetical protein